MCKHYGGLEAAKHVCRAFQKGIPNEITAGRDDHVTIRLGQGNKIIYEQASSYAEMEMFKSKRGF
jgi:hypothetical protein